MFSTILWKNISQVYVNMWICIWNTVVNQYVLFSPALKARDLLCLLQLGSPLLESKPIFMSSVYPKSTFHAILYNFYTWNSWYLYISWSKLHRSTPTLTPAKNCYVIVIFYFPWLLDENGTPSPSSATAGPGKTLSWGPITPHSVCLEIETPKASRGRKRGEGCPLTIRLRVRGSVVISPSENGFYAYFWSERSHLEHHF